MQNVHPKVKVPAVVGTVIAIVLAVLAGLSAVPEFAPYVAIGVTAINSVAGYLTYSPR